MDGLSNLLSSLTAYRLPLKSLTLKSLSFKCFSETGGLDEAALWLTQNAVPLQTAAGGRPTAAVGGRGEPTKPLQLNQQQQQQLFFQGLSISFATLQVCLFICCLSALVQLLNNKIKLLYLTEG